MERQTLRKMSGECAIPLYAIIIIIMKISSENHVTANQQVFKDGLIEASFTHVLTGLTREGPEVDRGADLYSTHSHSDWPY